MERRFVLFVVLSILILVGNLWLQTVLHPPAKVPPGQKANEAAAEKPEQAKEAPKGELPEAKPAEAPRRRGD